MKELNRRDFIKLAALGGAGIVGAKWATDWITYFQSHDYDQTFREFFDRTEGLSFDEASAMAVRFYGVLNSMPTPEFQRTPDGLLKYAMEILPQFEYEGIVSSVRFPEEVKFQYFPDGDRANHVLGVSDCQTFAVENSRIALDTSSWARDEEVFTIAHELAHVQQGAMLCNSTETSLIENSAQIGAMEVVCGLANQGSPMYFWAALNELSGMALSAAYGLSLKYNQVDDYISLREKVLPGAVEKARFAKSRRRWDKDPSRLMEILEWYNITPMNLIVNAVRTGGNKITGLAFPEIHFNGTNPFYYQDQAEPIVLDDTAYVLAHMEEMAADFKKKS